MTLEDAVAWFQAGGMTIDEYIITAREILNKEKQNAIEKVCEQKSHE